MRGLYVWTLLDSAAVLQRWQASPSLTQQKNIFLYIEWCKHINELNVSCKSWNNDPAVGDTHADSGSQPMYLSLAQKNYK